jgi:anthranilate synthase component I
LDSVAPTVRSFSAEFEPLRLIARFPDCYPGLLESSALSGAADGGNRFDILPIASGECLALDSRRQLSGPHAAGAAGFLDALESWWRALRISPPPATSPPGAPILALPFSGGWLLYLGYELAAEIEPRVKFPPSSDPVIALAVRTPAAWVRDRTGRRAWLVAEQGHEGLLDRFARHVEALPESMPAHDAAYEIDEEDPAQFLEAVRRSLEYIAAGDVYQANLSRLWQGRSSASLDPVSIYRRLRAANPSPFAAIMRQGDFALMSSSPERLMSIRGNLVSTRPIAGTRARGATPEQDARIVRSLLDNEKERAEHVMLIDLERNDLGRVCVGGTVKVDEYMGVETYAHVHHIVSNISGVLREGVSPIQVIRALFPGGTITGCPKVRCMEIIAELEACGRGAYTGSVGYLNRDGGCDLNILIRTMTAERGAIRFRAGAGIVADSNPAAELAETRAKAKGLLRALEVP